MPFLGGGAGCRHYQASEDPYIRRCLDDLELRQLLARGGMGRVYLAERGDRRGEPVAVKLIGPESLSLANLRRFFEERRILHSLDHPHIVRFLGEGTTDDALPYFAMEYVEGEPIDRYCELRDLDQRRRLELIRTVCRVVGFVHRKRIVHRDLKPDNILVTVKGEVKLVDFGIAMRLAAPGSGAAPELSGPVPRTPRYASPEQLAGEAGSPASDIYSLGALSRRLVVWGGGAGAADLDAITKRAMHAEPRCRHRSADDLAAELGRTMSEYTASEYTASEYTASEYTASEYTASEYTASEYTESESATSEGATSEFPGSEYAMTKKR